MQYWSDRVIAAVLTDPTAVEMVEVVGLVLMPFHILPLIEILGLAWLGLG